MTILTLPREARSLTQHYVVAETPIRDTQTRQFSSPLPHLSKLKQLSSWVIPCFMQASHITLVLVKPEALTPVQRASHVPAQASSSHIAMPLTHIVATALMPPLIKATQPNTVLKHLLLLKVYWELARQVHLLRLQ